MKKLIILLGFISIGISQAWSQSAPVAHYSFDGCSFVNEDGDVATPLGSPSCDCAFSQDGLILDGVDQGVDSLSVPNGLLNQDFAIRFYINPSNGSGIYDILSKGNTCFDSIFSIKYDATFNAINVEMVQSSTPFFLIGDIVEDVCWHEILVMRRDDEYRLIIDGALSARLVIEGGLDIVNNAPFRLSNGPCQADLKFDGAIDELSFFSRSLGPNEYGQQLTPDRLLTRDTIIFVGDTVFARSLVNCAQTISWSPSADIDDTTIGNPALFPAVTTTYAVSYKSDNCFSIDSLRVIVTRPEDLDCEQLDLPTAFTPNADGLNDFYGISNPFIITELESFDIYDRQGAIVFSGANATDLWDGNVNGTRLIPGVYVYKVRYTCRGGDQLKIGSFTLMR